MLTSVIGAYPKPSYIKITDWFNAKGGTDTEHPTNFYNNEIGVKPFDCGVKTYCLFISSKKEFLVNIVRLAKPPITIANTGSAKCQK